jgi:hypothetical protein
MGTGEPGRARAAALRAAAERKRERGAANSLTPE